MIFSIHIPKTAGTSFRNALKERYGDRLALFYGARDPATHPLLRVPRRELASMVPELEKHGVEVLHGHYYVGLVKEHIADPSTQVWTWLRDPIERLISHYSFIGERETKWSFDKEVKSGDLSIVDFAQKRRIRNMHSEYLQGFELKDLAFVGITERFELGLALLFGDEAPRLNRRYNAVIEKVEISSATRRELYALNGPDIALYQEGLRLAIDRIADKRGVVAPERPKVSAAAADTVGVVRRLIRKVS